MSREIEFRYWNGYEMVEPIIEGYERVNNHLNFLENIMQYTGLKDKNGKKIFEGDIIEVDSIFSDKGLYIVYYSDNQGAFMAKDILGKKSNFGDDILEYYLGSINIDKGIKEIKGNVYENPELLPSKDTH